MTEINYNSPCISLCQLDDNKVCRGCFRHADEIRNWIYFDNQERRAVLERCHDRSLLKNAAK